MFKKMRLIAKLLFGFSVPLIAMAGIVIGIYVVGSGVKENAELSQVEVKGSFEFAILAQTMKLDVVQVQQWLTDNFCYARA